SRIEDLPALNACDSHLFSKSTTMEFTEMVAAVLSLSSAATSIGLCLEPERFLAYRCNKRVVVGGDDHDSRFGDRVPASILVRVVADERAAGNEDIAINNRSPDPRVAANPHAGHEDALL